MTVQLRWRAAFAPHAPLMLAGTGCWNAIESGRQSALGSNVLLVTVDTLRADHVGVYGAGGEATPMMDRLADEHPHSDSIRQNLAAMRE